MKILSIVVPSYNAEKFLENMVEKSLMRYDESLEILIINDGSSDSTQHIALRMEQKYPQVVKTIFEQNAGHGGAINNGISHATGKYLKVVDADDWLASENLEDVLSSLSNYPDVDVIFSPYFIFDEKKQKRSIVNIDFPKNYSEKATPFNDAVDITETPSMHGFIYRTDFLKNIEVKFDEHVFYDDAEYITLPLMYAQNFGVINKPIYVYRINEIGQSTTISNMLKNQDMHMFIVKTINKQYNSYKKSVIDQNRVLIENRLTQLVAAQYKLICLNDRVESKRRFEEFSEYVLENMDVQPSKMNLPIRCLLLTGGRIRSVIRALTLLKSKLVRI